MAGRGAAPGERRGGRKKGTPNKATAAKAAEIAAIGETPLDYMIRVMRDPKVDPLRRDKMAAAAAAFVHPKLNATTLASEPDHPVISEIRQVIIDPRTDH